jgi:hypothetical protein
VAEGFAGAGAALVVSMPGDRTVGTLRGAVRAFDGASLNGTFTVDDALLTVIGEADDDRFGGSLVPLRDADQDGYGDLLIGAQYATGEAAHSGAAYVIFGGEW